MRISKTLMMSAFAILIGSSAAISQSAPATKPTAGRSAPTSKAATDTDKKAISKACSDQATAKGLHGKERKAFRSACKRKGGKAA
jgi:psiF repeat